MIKMNNFTTELCDKLTEMLQPTIIKFDHEDIDDYFSKGHKIRDTVLVTSITGLENLHYIMTKHGAISVNYSPYLPNNSMILVNEANMYGERWTF